MNAIIKLCKADQREAKYQIISRTFSGNDLLVPPSRKFISRDVLDNFITNLCKTEKTVNSRDVYIDQNVPWNMNPVMFKICCAIRDKQNC